jgi:hypothetical protein
MEVLEIKNQCLLDKWLYKLLNKEGVWNKLLQNKFLYPKSLSEVNVKPNDSLFWKDLMRVKEDFFSRGSFALGNGESTRFWEDMWLRNKSLPHQYPSLYSIVQRKQVSAANVLSHNPLNITSRRTLLDHGWRLWLELVQRLMNVQLNSEKDNFVWSLTNSGEFLFLSLYLDLLNDDTKYLKKFI